MKTVLWCCFFLIAVSSFKSNAQITYGDSLSIQLEASVINSPASITLSWPADGNATNYKIYRKLKSGATFTQIATTLSNSTQYVDATIAINVLYDYKIYMTPSSGLGKYGYLSSGIDVIANSNRGIALIVIENSFIASTVYQTAISQLVDDIEADGWFPKLVYVNKLDLVTSVKTQIVSKYNENPTKTKLLLLLGNVPVPYSGLNNPDGHTDHIGAWPTDAYYSDINGNWTDATVNNVASSNPKNFNVPGDGKFDQDVIPSPVELQVGRIDLSDLPIYSLSEEELMLNYLSKLHKFKTKQIIVQDRALIDEGDFGSMTEGFTQNGYKNFSGLVGRNNIVVADYFTELSYNTSTTGTYLWSFGCGGGTYIGSNGIGTSSNFATDSLSSVFTMLFGSYYGDWNYQNGFLRMALTQGNTLTSAWAGRPNWHFYHMAMGENIGYSAQLTQNNSTAYVTNSIYTFFGKVKSINLMGDPTLRNHYVIQPTNLTISSTGFSNTLSWSAGGAEVGYNIYRRYSDSTNFVKLNSTLIASTNYSDNSLSTPGTVYYYVKAVEKRVTPSGTYDNESLGLKSNGAVVIGPPLSSIATIQNSSLCVGNSTQLFSNSINGTGTYTYSWTSSPIGFVSSDRNPIITPTINTTYFVTVNDGVGAVTSSVSITVNDNPIANAGTSTTITSGTSTTLFGSALLGDNNYSFLWAPSSSLATNATDQNPTTTNLTVATTYTLTVTDGNGCTSTAEVTIDVTGTINIVNVINKGLKYEVIPNPFIDNLSVIGENITKIEVANANGAIVKTVLNTSKGNVELNLSQLNEGIYFINIISDNGTIEHKKILKLN